jgi:hypothetical protein
MSSVLRPRGPQKPSVYWRRRAVALLIVLAIPITVGFLIFRGGASEAEPQAEAEPQPTASGAPAEPAAEPTEGVQDDPSAEPDPSAAAAEDQPTAEPTPAAPACSEEGIAVVVSTDAESYGSDAKPQITMTITNAAGDDCLRDIGAGANEIVITSGGYHVWSSDDCDPSDDVDEQVMPAGVEAATTVTWDRVLSAPGCGGSGAQAQPGTYQLEGRNGTVVSEPVRFVLR